MPRIRYLKPEHRQHRKIGPLSDREYRLWVGMILESDDDGRFVADTNQLRALVWPYHSVTSGKVEAALQVLAEVGLIRLYEIAGVRYGYFPSWHDHQYIQRRQASKLPLPPQPNDEDRTPPIPRPEVNQSKTGVFRYQDRSGIAPSFPVSSLQDQDPVSSPVRQPVDSVDNTPGARPNPGSIRSALALDSEPGHQRTGGALDGTGGQKPPRGLTVEEDRARLEALRAHAASEEVP